MRIEEMIRRENFYPILEKTLEQYYADILGIPCAVKISDKKQGAAAVVYPKLNRIIQKMPALSIIQNTYGAFNINDNLLKNLLAKVYVTATLFSCGLLARKGLHLSQPSLLTAYHAIMPGNKKIRIGDFKNNVLDVIVKDGFRDDYFRNELRFRLEQADDFIVPILEHGENWYREKMIRGVCLARIRDKACYDYAVNSVLECLKMIYARTGCLRSAEMYITALTQRIQQDFQLLQQEKTDLEIAAEELLALVDKLSKTACILEQIPTMRSHGDMQTGNVLVENGGKVYIIDWETVAERSIWYDPTTLLLFTRRQNRWTGIVRNRNNQKTKDAVLALDNTKDRNMDGVAALLLLEDLDFRITDARMIPGDRGCVSLNGFVKELKGVQDLL